MERIREPAEIFGAPLVPPRTLARVPLDPDLSEALTLAGAPKEAADGYTSFLEAGDPLDLPERHLPTFEPRAKLQAVADRPAKAYAVLRRQLGERFVAILDATSLLMRPPERAALRRDGRQFAAMLGRLLPFVEPSASDRTSHEDLLRGLQAAQAERAALRVHMPARPDPWEASPLSLGYYAMTVADRLSRLAWADPAAGQAWASLAAMIASALLRYERTEKGSSSAASGVEAAELLANLLSIPSLR
jgi:hypothetical protein